MILYVLTREHNDYDQYGEYFVAMFDHIPTWAELRAVAKQKDEPELRPYGYCPLQLGQHMHYLKKYDMTTHESELVDFPELLS